MVLEIGNKQGHVVIDDNTGKIMTVLVKEGVKGKKVKGQRRIYGLNQQS